MARYLCMEIKSVNNYERKKTHDLQLADICDPIVVPISEIVCKSKMHCCYV
jgi:hypothetical protein